MFDSHRLDRIQNWMNAHVAARRLPGANVRIHVGENEIYGAEAGLRDLETGLPFAADTIVRLYSMTKPATSAILMMIVEEGRIHLDAPLSDILPEFAEMRALRPGATGLADTEAAPTPTLHQLLTHQSGLSYSFNPGLLPEAMTAEEIFFTSGQGVLGDMVTRLAALPLAFQPGTRWEYSVGIDVIGRVIEVLEDAPLDQVFRSRLLDPLGMNETGFSVPEAGISRFASLYTPLSGDPMAMGETGTSDETLRCVDRTEGSPFLDASLFSGGGGLVGTSADYMRLARFLLTGRSLRGDLLSPATLRFMRQNHLRGEIASMGPKSFAEQPMEGMGFGIGGAVVLDAARARAPGHKGDFSWGGMASTFFWIDPVLNLSVVFLTQLSPSSSYPLRPELKAIVHGALSA